MYNAFRAHAKIDVGGHRWGSISMVCGKRIKSRRGNYCSVDGIVCLRLSGILAIIEIKNQRKWIYPCDPDLWDLIRKAYEVGAVPILCARKIYKSAKTYVLKRVGGIGLQMHAQFAPAHLRDLLLGCKHVDGLGFKDLYFEGSVPDNIHNAVDIVVDRIPTAWAQMQRVRLVVEPFLDILADEKIVGKEREHYYGQLQYALDSVTPWSKYKRGWG